MSRRNEDDYARIQRKKAEMRRRRKKKARQRLTVLIVAFIVFLTSISYITIKVVQGDVFIKETESSAEQEAESSGSMSEETADPTVTPTAEATSTPVPTEEATPTIAADTNTGYSVADWTYSTSESMPEGDIVDVSDIYSYDRMERDIYFLKQRYGSYMHVNVIGYSCDGRELLDCVVGSDSATKDIIIQYSMHAREYIVTSVGMLQLENILKNYETGSYNGKSYADMLSSVRLHVIPMINPDGVTLSQTGSLDCISSEELKNTILTAWDSDNELGKGSPDLSDYLRTWKANARCVDLNRNFASTGWRADMDSLVPSTTRYPGAEPNSEPEVQAILNLEQNINCVAQVAYHCHGNMIYYDYGMESEDPELYNTDYEMARKLAATTANADGETYNAISTVEDDQNPGGCSDYFMQILHIPSVTIEVADNYKADGSYNDPPIPNDQVTSIYERNASILPALADMFA